MNIPLAVPNCCNREIIYYPPVEMEASTSTGETEQLLGDQYYKDITEVHPNERYLVACFQHYMIFKTSPNTYVIHNGGNRVGWSICFFIFTFLISGGILIYGLYDKVELIGIIVSVGLPFILLFTCSMCFSCRYHYTTVILGPNSMTIDQKAVFRKRTIVYNAGELERAQLVSSKRTNSEDETLYTYQLFLMPKTGSKIDIYHLVRGNDFRIEEFRGIKYFIDILNFHINNNMKV